MTVPEGVTFRVAGLTLLPGEVIPAEFESLVPDSFKAPVEVPKPTAKETK